MLPPVLVVRMDFRANVLAGAFRADCLTEPIQNDSFISMKTAVQLAEEYASLVRESLGSHVMRIILFGSQARGNATEKSDYDLLVILDKKSAELREVILDAGAEMMNRYDRLFAALIYDEQEWNRTCRFPLGWNIEQEGIAV